MARSKFESAVLKDLDSRGKVYTYEAMELSYKGRYIPDLVLPSGVIVELKGKFEAASRTKMLAVREYNPLLDIRFVFQKLKARLPGAQKRKDGTYMTCEEWAIKHNYQYSEGTIPEEWFNG